MSPSEVRFEDLVGRVVRNDHGREIARIEDLRVEPEGEDYVVTEVLIGPLELWPRIMAFMGEVPTLRALGLGGQRQLRPVPWHWIDLTDPKQPRLVEKEGKAGQEGKDGKGRFD